MISEFADQIRAAHAAIRDEVRDLSTDALNWTPCEGANSIAVLVTHLLGSELEVVRLVARVETARDRPAEFRATGLDASHVGGLLDEADAVVGELAPRIGETELKGQHVRPTARNQGPRSGEYLLMSTLGHAREHLGQILLTKQLHENETGRPA